MAQLKAMSPCSSINLAFHAPKRGSLLYHDKLSFPRKLHSFQEFGSRASELNGRAVVSSTCNVIRACEPKAIQAVLSSEREVESAPKSGGGRRG